MKCRCTAKTAELPITAHLLLWSASLCSTSASPRGASGLEGLLGTLCGVQSNLFVNFKYVCSKCLAKLSESMGKPCSRSWARHADQQTADNLKESWLVKHHAVSLFSGIALESMSPCNSQLPKIPHAIEQALPGMNLRRYRLQRNVPRVMTSSVLGMPSACAASHSLPRTCADIAKNSDGQQETHVHPSCRHRPAGSTTDSTTIFRTLECPNK